MADRGMEAPKEPTLNEIMRLEILDSPQAIRESLPVLREQAASLLRKPQPRRLILVGSGDSLFAAMALREAIHRRTHGEVHARSALDAARYWEYEAGDLLVAISISGESARVVEAGQAARSAGGSVLAVTGRAGSTLGSLADSSLVIPFHSRSRKTPHTTDYVTTLLALAVLAEAYSGQRLAVLDELAGLVGETLARVEAPCSDFAQRVVDAQHFFFVGAGQNLPTASYGAAKFWEAGGIHAHAFEAEEFAHGPHLMVEAGDPAVLISPSGRSSERVERLAGALEQLGSVVAVIADGADGSGARWPTPGLDEEWSPFVSCLPLQWLCHAVSTAKGYDVVRKDGHHANPGDYEALHWAMVRG